MSLIHEMPLPIERNDNAMVQREEWVTAEHPTLGEVKVRRVLMAPILVVEVAGAMYFVKISDVVGRVLSLHMASERAATPAGVVDEHQDAERWDGLS